MAEPATELNSLKRVSIVQQVEQVIADRIVDGTYAVDTKLPAEMTLSKQLGVGRGTVREAFRLLEAKGLVEIRPGRGAFVASDKEPTKWSFWIACRCATHWSRWLPA